MLRLITLGQVAEEVMGADSVMSIENSNDENLSIKYFELLSDNKKAKDDIERELNRIEIEISDPGVRALLKMKRLEKNT